MALIHKDGVVENLHPLNLVDSHAAEADELAALADATAVTADVLGRPPLFEVYMRMAEELAKRSTCARLQVGTVITDAKLENVVAIGYNGKVQRSGDVEQGASAIAEADVESAAIAAQIDD